MVGFSYMMLILILTLILYNLLKFGIEKSSKRESNYTYAFTLSVLICLRAIINKATDTGLKSQTYRLIVVIVMTLSFIVLSYYRAQMNAALNVDFKIFPINTLEDIDKSNYKVLLAKGTTLEDQFKNAEVKTKQGKLLRKIYDEKIAIVPDSESVAKIGIKKTIQTIMNGNTHIAYGTLVSYQQSPYYPCKIIDIKSIHIL